MGASTWYAQFCLGQSLQHDCDHGELGDALGDDGEGFIVGYEAAVAPEPGEGALDEPPPPDDLEATVLVGALDDLERDGVSGEVGIEPHERTCRR